MQMSAAMRIERSAISRALSVVLPASARAAASAYGPPDPIPTIPSSGWIRSPERAVGPPIARELDGRAFEVAAVLFELRLEPRKEGERVGGGAGEPGEDP